MQISPVQNFLCGHFFVVENKERYHPKLYIQVHFKRVVCMRFLLVLAAASAAVLASAQPTPQTTPQTTSLPPLPVTQVGSKTIWNIFTIL